MRILISNDDGINAPGLAILEEIAAKFSDDIWVVAPAEEQSGAGHSLSLSKPVRIRTHGPKRYSVTGTPTDSVMLGIGKIIKDHKPDLLLSGVNRGANLGDDVTYSGTVAAAMEGTLAGIKSIALSQVYSREGSGDNVTFDCASKWGEEVLRPLMDMDFAPRMLMNINFPPHVDKVKGIKTTCQGFHDYGRAAIIEGQDPRGYPYYWFGLHGIEHTPGHDSDLEAIADNYISVTPLQLDLTHQQVLSKLRNLYP